MDGFYGMDLKYDLAINLAALHIQQKALDAACGRLGKVSVRRIEREFGGLGKFVPADHLDSRRGKDMRKTLEQQIKLNENLACPGEKHMNSLQCKIHYLNLASDIFSYGGRYFNVELSRGDAANPGFTKVCQFYTWLVRIASREGSPYLTYPFVGYQPLLGNRQKYSLFLLASVNAIFENVAI